MKTFSAKPHEVQHDWVVVDATDKVLGRLAAVIAHRLRPLKSAGGTVLASRDLVLQLMKSVAVGTQ